MACKAHVWVLASNQTTNNHMAKPTLKAWIVHRSRKLQAEKITTLCYDLTRNVGANGGRRVKPKIPWHKNHFINDRQFSWAIICTDVIQYRCYLFINCHNNRSTWNNISHRVIVKSYLAIIASKDSKEYFKYPAESFFLEGFTLRDKQEIIIEMHKKEMKPSRCFASGLDFIKHGEFAYPHKSQGDGWQNLRPRYSMELSTHRPTAYQKQPSIDSVKEVDESKFSKESVIIKMPQRFWFIFWYLFFNISLIFILLKMPMPIQQTCRRTAVVWREETDHRRTVALCQIHQHIFDGSIVSKLGQKVSFCFVWFRNL